METLNKWSPKKIATFSIVFAIIAILSCLYYKPRVELSSAEETALSNMSKSVKRPANPNKTKPLYNPLFPRCYAPNIYTSLNVILTEYNQRNIKCNSSKNKVKKGDKEENKERTGLIVAYAAVALLLVSLIAAFLELIKAKKDPIQNKSKPELSRRCSLADLTVLRHTRRESLMRRDSSLSLSSGETPGRVSLKTIGRKMSRPRLRVN